MARIVRERCELFAVEIFNPSIWIFFLSFKLKKMALQGVPVHHSKLYIRVRMIER